MMKTHRVMVVVGLAVVAGALAIWVVNTRNAPPEPVYEGKKLSVWLRAAGSTNGNEAVEACQAISSMGSNAAPFIMHRLKREAWKTYWLRKADQVLHTGTKFEQMDANNILAIRRGVHALRPSALPALEQVMEESSNEEVLYQAYSVGEMMVMVSSDSRFRMSLSSNAV